jgi:hypothetical protein
VRGVYDCVQLMSLCCLCLYVQDLITVAFELEVARRCLREPAGEVAGQHAVPSKPGRRICGSEQGVSW